MYKPNSPAFQLFVKLVKGDVIVGELLNWLQDVHSSTCEYTFLKDCEIKQVDFIRIFLFAIKSHVRNILRDRRAGISHSKKTCRKFSTDESQKANLDLLKSPQSRNEYYSPVAYDTNFPSLSGVKHRPKNESSTWSSKANFNQNSPNHLGVNPTLLGSPSDINKLTPKESNSCAMMAPWQLYTEKSIRGISPQLQTIICVYIEILNGQMCASITSELAFMMNVLCHKEFVFSNTKMLVAKPCIDVIKDLQFIKSKEECCIFAVEVLNSQRHILTYLDNVCLKSLSRNALDINQQFAVSLLKATSLPTDYNYINDLATLEACTKMLQNVDINLDESNVNNNTELVINEFHLLASEWQNNISLNINDFKLKVSTLVEKANQDSSTMTLLAEIFVRHLIRYAQFKDCVSDSYSDLNNSRKEKYVQLEKRLVQPRLDTKFEEYHKDDFDEAESFYKEFILLSLKVSPTLILFIKQSLILTYKELAFKMESNGNIPLYTLGSGWYFTTVKILQCLGKFLGFIEFVHYHQNTDKISKSVFDKQVNLRTQVHPPMEFSEILKKASENGTLILIVPWIVEYLMMCDMVALEVPYINHILITLMSIKVTLKIKGFSVSNSTRAIAFPLPLNRHCNNYPALIHLTRMSAVNMAYLAVTIGKLFNSSAFYEEKFYYLMDHNIAPIDIRDILNYQTLDNSNVITKGIFLETCKVFRQLKNITLSHVRSTNNSARHITPTSLTPASEQSPTQLKDKLEASFFSGYKGLSIIADFLSNRIAQICEKNITAIYKENSYTIAMFIQQQKITEELGVVQLDSKTRNMIDITINELNDVIKKEIKEIKENRLWPAFRLLHDPDLPPSAVATAEKLMAKKVDIKIENWIKQTFGTTEDIISRTIEECCDLKRLTKLHPYLEGDNISLTPSLLKLEELIYQVYFGKHEDLDVKKILPFLNSIVKDAMNCADNNEILSTLYTTSWDLLWCLVSRSPKLVTRDFIFGLIPLWKSIKSVTTSDNEKRILCPRNIRMAHLSQFQADIPATVALIFKCLIEKNFITVKEFEDQSLQLFHTSWQKEETHFITKLLEEIKTCLPQSDSSNGEGLLLEWALETSHQFDEDFD